MSITNRLLFSYKNDHMHTCGNISISEILYHYHDMDNYIAIIDISIILHITSREHYSLNYYSTHTMMIV